MNYILTFVKQGQVQYDENIVGNYDRVRKVAAQCAPGLIACAVSYHYFLGHAYGQKINEFNDELEKTHFMSGQKSAQKLPCQIIK
jgi:hypothetical protein